MTHTREDRLRALRTDSGIYAMVAIDQRESLRGMLPSASDGSYASDEDLVDFKVAAAQSLGGIASGILVDRPFGLPAGARPDGIPEDCGLIVAADILHQRTGELLTHSSVDPEVTVQLLDAVGAVAVKFLILWKIDETPAQRRAVLEPFMELVAESGALSLVEGIVRPAGDRAWRDPRERHDAILDAAAEFAAYGPDLYKAEVPGYVSDDITLVADHARQMTSILPMPWVVLSNGVAPEMFPSALAEALAGGASGFLAGRAVWQRDAEHADFAARIARDAPARLQRLVDIGERHARSTAEASVS